jgi:hypothetical protein
VPDDKNTDTASPFDNFLARYKAADADITAARQRAADLARQVQNAKAATMAALGRGDGDEAAAKASQASADKLAADLELAEMRVTALQRRRDAIAAEEADAKAAELRASIIPITAKRQAAAKAAETAIAALGSAYAELAELQHDLRRATRPVRLHLDHDEVDDGILHDLFAAGLKFVAHRHPGLAIDGTHPLAERVERSNQAAVAASTPVADAA